jgi:hypothetical protein
MNKEQLADELMELFNKSLVFPCHPAYINNSAFVIREVTKMDVLKVLERHTENNKNLCVGDHVYYWTDSTEVYRGKIIEIRLEVDCSDKYFYVLGVGNSSRAELSEENIFMSKIDAIRALIAETKKISEEKIKDLESQLKYARLNEFCNS